MIRYTLLTLVITFLCLYAWKDWYRSLCGLIVLMAFLERYDMPRQMLGIPGLNPWNLVMLFLLVAMLLSRKRENLRWNMPPEINVLLALYAIIILVGFIRMLDDMQPIREFFILSRRETIPTLKDYILDDIINSFKYVLPGMLLFYGCNSEERLKLGISAILLTLLLLGLQIIKWMPLGDIGDGDALSDRALRVLDRGIGYHRVDLAALMASGSWVFFIARMAVKNALVSKAFLFCGLLLVQSLALTGGRTGSGTWVVLGLGFAALRYRKLLFGLPILIIAVIALVPAVQERMLQGFETDSVDQIAGESETDLSSVTSGRILIWPTIIDYIKKEPLIGYGRRGMHTSGASVDLRDLLGAKASFFGHPHNAYLELLIDNGIIGAIPILLFFYLTIMRSAQLFRHKEGGSIAAIGGIALALIGAQLIASVGAQSFYPRSGVVLMWSSIGMMYAVYVRMPRQNT